MTNGGTISKMWDMDTDYIPFGMTLDYSSPSPQVTHRVHSMAQGKKAMNSMLFSLPQ